MRLTLLVGLLLVACAEDTNQSVYPESAAREAALAFVGKCLANDGAAARALAGAPFRFRTRDWATAADVDRELPKQMAAIAREAGVADTCEVWPYARLLAGQWPRGEVLTAEQSAERLSALGVDPNGFLVRLAADVGSAATLRVGPDPSTRLVVTGLLTLP